METKMNVAEIFYSIQGEGSTVGKPSVFLRLTGCNLMCGGRGTEKDGKLHNGASWRCDTIEVWKQKNAYSIGDLADQLHKDYVDKFMKGAQLIITGGEPMLQQNQFPYLISDLRSKVKGRIRVEVETNGTIFPNLPTEGVVDQFNVSPKLSNSGMLKERRIKETELDYFAKLAWDDKAIFKFVVTDKSDIVELFDDFIDPFGIPHHKIWLMPGCSTLQQFQQVAPKVAKFCKRFGFNFSSRLQINLWNQTTGV